MGVMGLKFKTYPALLCRSYVKAMQACSKSEFSLKRYFVLKARSHDPAFKKSFSMCFWSESKSRSVK